MRRPRHLTVELLEDRSLPSVFGMPWSDAAHLSVSFAPDGTAIDNQSSALFQTLNSQMATATWQREILRAIQTWAVQANINVGLVADGGQPIGTLGAIQSDSRFGDLRIVAKAMTKHIANSAPFNVLSSTRAGDIAFSTGVNYYVYTPGGLGFPDPNRYDVFSVTLDEIGNALGLADTDDPTSAVYRYYTGPRIGLNAGDIAALQALYGARQADDYEGVTGNDTFATATTLTPGLVSGDITTLNDADVYRLVVPNGTTVVSVRVRNAGISLLAPKLTIYDSDGNVVATAATDDPQTGRLTLQLNNVSAGQIFYAKVESGVQNVFGIGAYHLRFYEGPSSNMPSVGPSNNVVDDGDVFNDYSADDTLATATNLVQAAYETDRRFDYRIRAKIRNTSDVDYYRLTSPTAAPGTTQTLEAMVWALNDAAPLYSKISVYDAAGNLVNADILVNDHGNYVVQVANAASNATYYVKVESTSTNADHDTGKYFLGVDFQSQATVLDNATSGTLSNASLEAFTTLHNQEAQVFHFVLSSGTAPGVETAIRVTIYDANNNVVFSMIAKNGDMPSANVFLAAGDYTIRFEGGAINNQPLPPVAYQLRALVISDPLDPPPVDVTGDPPGGPTYTVAPDGGSVYGAITALDPYSNPWDELFGF